MKDKQKLKIPNLNSEPATLTESEMSQVSGGLSPFAGAAVHTLLLHARCYSPNSPYLPGKGVCKKHD